MTSNRWITIDDRTQTIGAWAKEVGLDERHIRIRIARGWTEREAVLTPKIPNRGHHNGEAAMIARRATA
jgi:hypothetical protein